MNYFPMFVNLEGKRVFVAGGGPVAYRKSQTLLAFGCEITVFAKEALPAFHECGQFRVVEGVLKEEELEELLSGFDMVIAATSIRELNRRIASICKKRHIPVNVADNGGEGSFLFPAVVGRGSVTIGISSGGRNPAFSGWLRKKLSEILPDSMGKTVRLLDDFEKELKKRGVDHEECGNIIRDILHKTSGADGFPDCESVMRETSDFLQGMC